MTADELLAHVNLVRATLLDGAMDDVVEDTGGWGLCEYASEELVLALEDLDPEMNPESVYADPNQDRWRTMYRDTLSGPHWVVRVDDLCVDLTARQFDPTLPYPYIFPFPGDP